MRVLGHGDIPIDWDRRDSEERAEQASANASDAAADLLAVWGASKASRRLSNQIANLWDDDPAYAEELDGAAKTAEGIQNAYRRLTGRDIEADHNAQQAQKETER